MPQTVQYALQRAGAFRRQFAYIPRTFLLISKAAPGWTGAWLVMLVVQGLLPIAMVYLTRAVVNDVVAAVRADGMWTALRPTLIAGAALGAVMLATEVAQGFAGWVRTAQSELAQDYITGLIQRKSVEVDLAFYELPDFYDHLHRARLEATYRPALLVESIGSVLQNGITFIAMAAVLAPFGPVLPMALLLSTLPALYIVLRSSSQRHQFAKRSTTAERQSWYYDDLLTSGSTAAEIRLFGLDDYFQRAYALLREHLRGARLHLARHQALGELWATLAAMLVTGAAMLWMLWRAVRGQVTLGDLAMFYQAFNQGLGLARSLLENVGRLYENSLFLGSLFEFLALQPQINSPARAARPPVQISQGVRFRHVSFRYPGSERMALRDFDLTIAPGQMIAIVGPNGAGKSTLVKLLCRFYEPDQGSIEIDGTPLGSFSLAELRNRISVLFQQPVHFEATASDTIRFGDFAHRDARRERCAAAEAGADEFIQRLPRGFDTHLGKSFAEGTELSVGEWQRMAMARAFFRDAPILLLDEPTSAMDPWAEIEWARRFRERARGRIAIIVTHRFTTAMFADVIHVMRDSRIIESGTHEQLSAVGGLYAQGWAAQANARAGANLSERSAA